MEEKPTADKALIIVERDGGGEGIGNSVYDNQGCVGKVGTGGKLVWLRNPGLMDIQMHLGGKEEGNPMFWGLRHEYSGRGIVVEVGKIYRYEIKSHWINGFTFTGPGIPTEYFDGPGFRIDYYGCPLSVKATLKVWGIFCG